MTGPASGHRLRPFALPATDGQVVRLRDYRQRRNLVLFFHHGPACAACRAVVHMLAVHVPTYRAENAAVLAIDGDHDAAVHAGSSDLPRSFPLLHDAAGAMVTQLGLDVPALVVADQWGELWAAWRGGADHRLPDATEIEDWLAFIQAQCMTCTISWLDHGSGDDD